MNHNINICFSKVDMHVHAKAHLQLYNYQNTSIKIFNDVPVHYVKNCVMSTTKTPTESVFSVLFVQILCLVTEMRQTKQNNGCDSYMNI